MDSLSSNASSNSSGSRHSELSDTRPSQRNTPKSQISDGDLPSPFFQGGGRFEFVTPRIPTPEVPSVSVQEDLLRELEARFVESSWNMREKGKLPKKQ
jgi:hypothetical protein